MKLISTIKKFSGLVKKLYKLYDNLPDEKKEKINKAIIKAAERAIG